MIIEALSLNAAQLITRILTDFSTILGLRKCSLGVSRIY